MSKYFDSELAVPIHRSHG